MNSKVAQAAALFVANAENGLTEDSGGLTNWGIAQKYHPELTADQIRNVTMEQAMAIYLGPDYYGVIHGDELPPAAAFVMLDSAVNQGGAACIRCMQLALGCPVDGVMGPQTLKTIGNTPTSQMLEYFTAERILRYAEDPTWKTDGRGWIRRAVAAALAALDQS